MRPATTVEAWERLNAAWQEFVRLAVLPIVGPLCRFMTAAFVWLVRGKGGWR